MADKDLVGALLQLHPRTHMQQAGIRLEDKPSALFRALCAALLFSARISAGIAITATRSLADAGWTTPRKLAGSTWQQRAKVLNEAGYARYDERTAGMLGDTAELLLERYGGDLRRLREDAGHNARREQALLTDFKGIGAVGAAIFCREVQLLWPELHPFADDRALVAAGRLGLGEDAGDLTRLVADRDLPRLLSALVRVDADDDYARVRAMAAGDPPAAGGAPADAGKGGQTKRELYQRARELGIPGRSKMDKAALARAVRRAVR